MALETTSSERPRLRIAVDIGGTFTDLVHLDEETGDVGLAKAPTTPPVFEDSYRFLGINRYRIDTRS